MWRMERNISLKMEIDIAVLARITHRTPASAGVGYDEIAILQAFNLLRDENRKFSVTRADKQGGLCAFLEVIIVIKVTKPPFFLLKIT